MNIEKRQNFVILDANAFVHSSFHGYPNPMLDVNGEDQKVLYGIIQTLVGLTYELPSIDALYVVFDPSDGSDYRKNMFPAYKTNRPPTDPDLARQREMAQKVILDHLGIPCVSYPKHEADDIIGSIAKCVSKTHKVIIVSPDKDLAQLVGPNVTLLRKIRTKTQKGYSYVTQDNIYEKFGVHAYQIPDWLALMGDTADNLPGIEGIANKGACSILSQYPSIEHLVAISHEIEDDKLKSKIVNGKEQLFLVKKLATIVCDLPVADLIDKAMEKAIKIRSNENYNKKLLIMQKHYNWPPYFIELFLN